MRNKISRTIRHSSFSLALLVLLPCIGLAHLEPRPDLRLGLNTEKDEENASAAPEKNPLPLPRTASDERKRQAAEALSNRSPMNVERMRAGFRRQNLDYEIWQVGTPNAANDLYFGMDLQVGVGVRVNGAAAEDRVVFYAGVAERGSNEAVVLSERFEGTGPGPHVMSFQVPVDGPLVRGNRFDGDLILLGEKTMPGLPGRTIAVKRFIEDRDLANHREPIQRRVLRPEVSFVRVGKMGSGQTVAVGDTIKLNITARLQNAGPMRQGISFAVGDPDAGRIDATGPKVFRQGDGEFPEVTMQFRVQPHQVVDGEFRTTLFVLRDSKPSESFESQIFVDSDLSDHQRILSYRGQLSQRVQAELDDIAFSMLTYNIFMRPQPPFFDGQMKRAERLVPHLVGKGYDLIAFNEIFGNRPRNFLVEALSHEFPYHTTVIGKSLDGRILRGGVQVEASNGGVMIFSRWPIHGEEERLFDQCKGSDCMAAKGVQRVAVEKQGRMFHVFATHLQASCGRSDDSRWPACQSQIHTIRNFIDESNIPEDEPVLIAGDMNVNREGRGGELYRWMLEKLDARDPGLDRCTRDTELNELADGTACQYLDYILVSENHATPVRERTYVLRPHAADPWRLDPLASPRRDLSDHYPVLGRFEFAFPARGQ